MRKPSITTIIASVALFFSLAGTGIAAQHFLITSLSQIAPKVRRDLRGHTGPAGSPGIQGVPGPAGPAGPAGPSFDWSTAYYVASDATALTTSQPATVVAVCHVHDRAITGGYSGWNEIVTTDVPVIAMNYPGAGWQVTAHLDPAAPNGGGGIQAWVLCVTGS